MSNVIKKIKIKQQDGTFTDYIPIGAEAENVNVDGESVEEKLNKMPYYYNSVADMKADESLKAGDMVITLGYYELNDGGSSKYKIVNSLDTHYPGILLNNGLYGQYIFDGNECNPLMFGAYHDGIHNDSSAVQAALDMLHFQLCKVLDLKGFIYTINTPLHLDSNYKCIIKNGQLISTNIEFSQGDTSGFILETTNTRDEMPLQPGSYGYTTEDLIITEVTFDCSLQENLGCINFKGAFFRVTIDKCDFRRYKTYGVRMNESSSSDGHEMLVTNSFFRAAFNYEENTSGIGLHITKHDNYFNNLTIVGGSIGIQVIQSANVFSDIHIYGSADYNMKIDTVQIDCTNMYFDGGPLYINKPWHVNIVNAYFLTRISPIIFDRPQTGIYQIKGVVIEGKWINLNNSESAPLDLIAFPNGTFQGKFINSNINISVNDPLICIDNSEKVSNKQNSAKYNYARFIDKTTNYKLNQDGLNIVAIGNSNYTYTLDGNVIDITSYNDTGYTWLGFEIKLPTNTIFQCLDRYSQTNGAVKIIGFNGNLEAGNTGTLLKDSDANRRFRSFNSGEYDHYLIAFYGGNRTIDMSCVTTEW